MGNTVLINRFTVVVEVASLLDNPVFLIYKPDTTVAVRRYVEKRTITKFMLTVPAILDC